jgi:hypothetical protein
MPKTRAKAASSSSSTAKVHIASRYELANPADTAPNVFILPSKASSEARIVTLPNPRTCRASRYLACPNGGLFEFTKIVPGAAEPRSWLIEGGGASTNTEGNNQGLKTQVAEHADLYIATSVDLLFLVILALVGNTIGSKADQRRRMFLSLDDHFEPLSESHPHLSEILRWKGLKDSFEVRMRSVSDTVDAGDEKMFRLNEAKLLKEVTRKALRMSECALPSSMEDKFVKKALEAPIMSVRSADSKGSANDNLAGGESVPTPKTGSDESQASTASVDSVFSTLSEASSAATSSTEEPSVADVGDDMVAALQAPDQVIKLQRAKVSFDYICARYISPGLTALLKASLSKDKGIIDLTPLDEYHKKLAAMRQDALSSRSLSDYSRKRPFDEEDEERAEKRRRKEEEERRKKLSESRGVRDLKKVNVSGMKKMSDFFKKK